MEPDTDTCFHTPTIYTYTQIWRRTESPCGIAMKSVSLQISFPPQRSPRSPSAELRCVHSWYIHSIDDSTRQSPDDHPRVQVPDPHCASCNGTFVEMASCIFRLQIPGRRQLITSVLQLESTQDDPRTFHNGGDFDDFPGKHSLNPPARFWLIDQGHSYLKCGTFSPAQGPAAVSVCP